MKLLKKLFAWFECRSLETELHDVIGLLNESEGVSTTISLILRREEIREELAAARSRYLSFSKPGYRKTWTFA